jgi:hypothetical protein
VFAQEEQEAISSFEKQVQKYEKFFSSKPKVLFKQSYSFDKKTLSVLSELKSSPTGYVFHYKRFDDYTISYDVRKTDSLVSPYMGYITVNYLETVSTKCGDFEIKSHLKEDPDEYFFTTLELARQKRDDESCYRPFQVGGKEIRRSAKFIFAFQKKQWVYKDVVDAKNEPNVVFYNAFGNPIYGRLYVEDNDFWKKLIE